MGTEPDESTVLTRAPSTKSETRVWSVSASHSALATRWCHSPSFTPAPPDAVCGVAPTASIPPVSAMNCGTAAAPETKNRNWKIRAGRVPLAFPWSRSMI